MPEQLDNPLDGRRAPTPVEEIAAERQRQISAEGWTPKHDDTHSRAEIARHAAALALIAAQAAIANAPHISPVTVERLGCIVGLAAGAVTPWPAWMHKAAHKPARRLLVQAGALIVAEIERLDRASIAAAEGRAP